MTDRIPKKYRKVIVYGILPAILVLYAFTGTREGVDVVDATFTLTGFAYPEKLNAFWRLAYYLPNTLGSLFTHLPGGNTLSGMNAYGSAIIALTALVAYYGLLYVAGNESWGTGKMTRFSEGSEQPVSSRGKRVIVPVPADSFLTFTAVLLAESLCWAPRTSLYNYLTYLFMTVGVVLLLVVLKAGESWGTGTMTRFSESGEQPAAYHLLALAGICFGLNVHVRFPNIVQAAFILLVWYDAWRKRESFKTAARKTAYCVAGYLIGFGIPFLVIVSQYGAGAYAEMIASLFGMTAGAQDYSAGGMLGAILSAYGSSVVKMWPLWVAVIVGAAVTKRVTGESAGTGTMTRFSPNATGCSPLSEKRVIVPVPHDSPTVITAVFTLIALLIMYRQGVFTRSYWYYDSVFELAMAFVILGIILAGESAGTGTMTRFSESGEQPVAFGEKRVIVPVPHDAPALAMILIILITPLGSNNYTYPLINNLFLVAPIVLLAAWRSFRPADGAPDENRTKPRRLWTSLYRSLGIALTCVTALLLFQGVLFHARYAFNDGTDGTPRNAVITAIPRAQGMKTTAENAAALESLYETLAPYRAMESEWAENGNEPWGMIMFGKAPGIPYLMEIEPAIFTSWPDLDTVSVTEWDQALRTVKGFPIIIIKKDPATGEPEITGENLGEEKWQRLQDYMKEKLYMKTDAGEAAPYTEYYDIYTSMASDRTYFY